jgi:hypothetical protein
MTIDRVLGLVAMVFTALVLVSILVNPTARNPLDWLWPPTMLQRGWELMTRANYVPTRSVNPVLGASMG